MDDVIGNVTTALKNKNMYEDTLIAFSRCLGSSLQFRF